MNLNVGLFKVDNDMTKGKKRFLIGHCKTKEVAEVRDVEQLVEVEDKRGWSNGRL